MPSTTILDAKEAKEEFSELISRVSHNKERIILTRRGKEVAVLIPMEDLLAIEASHNKNDLEEAVEALKEAREKGTLSLDELKETLGSTS